jgi:hypothetical protein
MLKWQDTPDAVFQEIVCAALELASDCVLDDSWNDFSRPFRRVFSRAVAGDLIRQLHQASRDEATLYEFTDYHALLLHEVLRVFCDISNDLADGDGEPTKVGPYEIRELNFEQMVGRFFWDEDFITRELLALSVDAREAIGASPETWGLLKGLKPHPDEIAVIPVTDEGSPPFRPRPWLGPAEINEYPTDNFSNDARGGADGM